MQKVDSVAYCISENLKRSTSLAGFRSRPVLGRLWPRLRESFSWSWLRLLRTYFFSVLWIWIQIRMDPELLPGSDPEL